MDPETQLQRLMARDGIDEAAARARIASQMPIDDKRRRADYVIDNSGGRAETDRQVRAVYARLLADLRARRAAEPAAGQARGALPIRAEVRRRATRDAPARSASTSSAIRRWPTGIVGLVGPGPRDLVVEIGPGDGALTGFLARSGRLVALEVDPTLAARLREQFAGIADADIVEADARRHDWAGAARAPARSGRPRHRRGQPAV